jgi:hypothetical protein
MEDDGGSVLRRCGIIGAEVGAEPCTVGLPIGATLAELLSPMGFMPTLLCRTTFLTVVGAIIGMIGSLFFAVCLIPGAHLRREFSLMACSILLISEALTVFAVVA